MEGTGDAASTVAAPAQAMPPTSAPQGPITQPQEQSPSSHSRNKIILAFLCGVIGVLLIVAVVIIANQQGQQQQVGKEAQGQAAREEEERLAARTIDMPYYTLVIPEYWVGKVQVITRGNDLTIAPKEDPYVSIIDVIVDFSGEGLFEMGDIGTSLIQYTENADGYHLELWMTRFTWVAGSPSWNSDPEAIELGVDLETGGELTAEDIKNASRPGSYWESEGDKNPYTFKADEYINENVVLTAKNGMPTIKVS